MTENEPKQDLADILDGKAEVLPKNTKTGLQIHQTSAKPNISNPEYLKGETIHSGGTIYDGKEPVFADESDDTIADIDAPPPPATYDVKTAGLMSYLIPIIGSFIVLGSVQKEDKEQRFHALQALVIQLIAFVVLGLVLSLAGFIGNSEFGFFKILSKLIFFAAKIIGFGFIIVGLICAISVTSKGIRIPYIAKLIDSQIK